MSLAHCAFRAITTFATTLALVPAAAAAPLRTATLKIAGSVPGSIVVVDSVRIGRTGNSGTAAFPFLPPGRRIVVVVQPGYAESRHTVSLVAGRPSVVRPARSPIPAGPEALAQRALFLAADGKHAEAIEAFRRAIDARNGAFPSAEVGLVRSLFARKDIDGAATAAEKVARDNPRNLEAQTVLANVIRDRGLYDEAVTAYRKAIALAPDRAPEAHTGLALALEERGDHEGAAAELKLAISQNLDAEPILYQLLGSILDKLDRQVEATAAYERFLVLAPSSALAPAVRSIVEQRRKPDSAEDDVNPYAPRL